MAGEIKKLRFDDGVTVTAPSGLTIDIGAFSSYADDAAYVSAKGSAASAGDIYYNSTGNLPRYYNGSAWGYLVDETTSQGLSNKTITGSSLNSSPVGASSPSTGAFTSLSTTLDLTVGGDLTVNGTTTTLNTATLDVEDINIKVNKGGNDALSEGAGLTIDRTGTKGSMIYAAASASRFKIGDLGTEADIATTSNIQDFTNKTITDSTNNLSATRLTSGTIPDARVPASAVTQHVASIDHDATLNFVANEHVNHGSVSISSGGALSGGGDITTNRTITLDISAQTEDTSPDAIADYVLTYDGSASAHKKVKIGNLPGGSGSGSGTGALNYISNPSAAVDLTGWTGTGLTVTRSTTAAELPRENLTMTGIKFAGTAVNDHAFFAFVLDDADVNKMLGIEFAFKPGSGYASGDFEVQVSDGVNFLPLSTAAIPNATGVFQSSFVSTSNLNYTFYINQTVAAVRDAVISDIVVGPGSILTGAAMTEWQSYTPALTATGGGSLSIGTGGSALAAGQWRQVGDSMEVQYHWTWGTTSTTFGTSGFYVFDLPSGYTADLSKLLSTSGSYGMIGTGKYYDSSASDVFGLTMVVHYSTGAVYAIHEETLSANYIGPTVPITMAINDSILANFTIPIAEWAGSGTLNAGSNNVEYYSYYDATATAANTVYSDQSKVSRSPGGSQFAGIASTTVVGGERTTYEITLPSDYQPSDVFELQVTRSNKDVWFTTGTSDVCFFHKNGNAAYGIGLQTSATALQVVFGNGGRLPGITYGAAGGTWSSLIAAATNWRVVRHKAGIPVGFGIATDNQYGLTRKNKIQTKTNSSTLLSSGTGAITFSNLVVGRVYRITLMVNRAIRTASGGAAFIFPTHDSVNLMGGYGVGLADAGVTTESAEVVSEISSSRIFTATATTLSVDYTVSSGQIVACEASLEELNNYNVTTDFT